MGTHAIQAHTHPLVTAHVNLIAQLVQQQQQLGKDLELGQLTCVLQQITMLLLYVAVLGCRYRKSDSRMSQIHRHRRWMRILCYRLLRPMQVSQ